MIKLKERQSIKFSNSDRFSRYCLKITDFCPFLTPAEKNDVLFTSKYYIDGETMEDLQETLFYIGVIEIERLRTQRFQYRNEKSLLYCENVIFELSTKFSEIDGEDLFSWPHYLLKLLYTQAGIMLGKFWINEKVPSKKGLMIPSPPCHFLSIRSAIKKRDANFLHKTHFLSPVMLESEDCGQNVHHLSPEGCDISLVESMRQHQYYQYVFNWGKRKVE